ncbi:MAG: hypothetical protein KO202_00065 [Methanobacteriaceae archaeon]|jgi:hypothetical protein|nr:hypothetical protein [Methanobacteriaceae archaeon]
MSPKKQATIFVFFIIAIIAIISSSFVYSLTVELIPDLQKEEDKLIPVEDDNFIPEQVNMIQEKKKETKINSTNDTINTTNISNYTPNETEEPNPEPVKNETEYIPEDNKDLNNT